MKKTIQRKIALPSNDPPFPAVTTSPRLFIQLGALRFCGLFSRNFVCFFSYFVLYFSVRSCSPLEYFMHSFSYPGSSSAITDGQKPKENDPSSPPSIEARLNAMEARLVALEAHNAELERQVSTLSRSSPSGYMDCMM